MNGSGIVPYNELTDAQVNCIAAMYGAAKADDFRAKTPGETGDSFIKNMVGASQGVLDGTECVGKFISIAWKDGGDYYADPEHWDKATDPNYPWPLIQPYAVFYKGSAAPTPTWKDWDGDDENNWPMPTKLTINGKVIELASSGTDFVIDGATTGLTREQVVEALKNPTCVTPTPGAGVVLWEKLTDQQRTAATQYSGDESFSTIPPGAENDTYVQNQQGLYSDLQGADCVGKLITIAWKDGSGDYYAQKDNWLYGGETPALQTVCVFYRGSGTPTPTWDDWTEDDYWPMPTKLTIAGKEISPAETGCDFIIDGTTTGLTKEQVVAALANPGCVTATKGAGVVMWGDLTETQKVAVNFATNGTDFSTKAPGAEDDKYVEGELEFATDVGENIEGAVCVGKLITIAWKNGDPDYYAKEENWHVGKNNTKRPRLQAVCVFYKGSGTPTPTWEITGINTRDVKLLERYATPDAGVVAYVNTKNAKEGTKLTIAQVENEAGDAMETPAPGLTMTISPVNASGGATITIKTTAQTPGGTYYFKVSDETGSVSKVQRFEVKKTYGVTLSVFPAAAANVWQLSASHDTIKGTNSTVYLPAGITSDFSSSASLTPVDSSGNAYYLKDHPASGEAYDDGKMYLFSHYEIKKNGVADDTVVNIMGRKLNGITQERNMSGKETMLVPAYDISVTAAFVEAYQLNLGDLPASSLFSWYREGDTVDLTNSIAAAEKAAQAKEDAQVIQSVLVHKTGDESTKVLEKTASQGYADVSFKMPAYPVSVKVTYAADTAPRLTKVANQQGTLLAGRKGEATLNITTKNVPDGTKLTIAACGITGTAATVNGMSLSISEVKDNKATVTVTTTEAIKEGTYYFKLSMPDKTVLKYSKNYHGIVTVSAAGTKSLSLGTQTGELTAGTAGSAAYAGTAFNLADTDTLTVAETDAKGTPKEVGKTEGLTLSVSAIKSEKFTVTAAITADVKDGTYYFVVSSANLKSAVASVVVQKKPEAKTYQIKTETYKNGYVSLDKQEAKEKETVKLTINPNTGYVLDSISVEKTDGTAVTLVGTGNTRTFEMPASDVTVKASFKEADEVKHRVTVAAAPGGTITVSPTEASKGETVTVTVTPDSGKQMVAGSLKYSESKTGGSVVAISGNSFVMPDADVSVSCQFETAKEGSEDIVITSFTINGVSAAINNESRAITIVMPYGTDLSKVAPVIIGRNIQSMTPASAQLVDLRNSKVYRFYAADGTYVSYNVSAYTEEPSPSQSLWGKLQDQINSNPNWWELAESQKKSGYYR